LLVCPTEDCCAGMRGRCSRRRRCWWWLAPPVGASAWRAALALVPRSLPRIWLAKDLRKALLRDRHPWLFDRALRGGASVEPGGVVGVNWRKETLALGLYDPASPLRVRLLTWGASCYPDDDWARRVAAAAAERRRRDPQLAGCSGVRLLHGESDWAPGFMLDSYGGVGVAAFDGAACEAFWLPRLAAVVGAFAAAGFVLQSVVRKGGGGLLWGEPLPPGASVFEENGVRFEVDVHRGHKTGFFLDQRGNRRRLHDLAEGKEVLDLFSYTGGFAVSAALGGARSTTSVDCAAPAVDASQRNFALNGLRAEVAHGSSSLRGQHRLHVADCWDFLREAAGRGQRFDVVVSDPPSMAPSARTRAKALRAYTQLNEGALAVLRPGGLLLACSCSSHITGRDLRGAVEQSALRAGRRIEVETVERAASDHPVRKGFPEGDYLQALYVRALQ